MKIQKSIITFNLILFLFFFGNSIIQKEEIRNTGEFVFLPLLPKDPRSLFQGDYMILRYDWSRLEKENVDFKRGCIAYFVENQILIPLRQTESIQDLKPNEKCLRYFQSSYAIKIGAESYFFQEGKGQEYERAKFAGLRIGKNGDKLLVGLFDENKKQIGNENGNKVP